MRLIPNAGTDRVIDELRKGLAEGATLDLATPAFSLFAFAEVRELLANAGGCRMILPVGEDGGLGLLGSDGDRVFGNRLTARWLARECREWINRAAAVREAPGMLPQSLLLVGHADPANRRAIAGTCPFTTDGLGLTAGNQFTLVQASEREDEWAMSASWFVTLWNGLPESAERPDRATCAALMIASGGTIIPSLCEVRSRIHQPAPRRRTFSGGRSLIASCSHRKPESGRLSPAEADGPRQAVHATQSGESPLQ